MAKFSIAIDKTLRYEGGFFHNPKTDEVVNRGITLWTLRGLGLVPNVPKDRPRSFRATLPEIEFVRNLTLPWTIEFYMAQYWIPWKFEALSSQPIADKCFDVGVNTYPIHPIQALQKAANFLYQESPLKTDGVLGPVSVARINQLTVFTKTEEQLLRLFRDNMTIYYKNAWEMDNSQPLKAWIERLERD